MASTATQSNRPPRSDVGPGTYAIRVEEDGMAVWEYRVGIDSPAGAWARVERLDHADQTRLNLEYAMLTPPDVGGYWVYATSYVCELDCD